MRPFTWIGRHIMGNNILILGGGLGFVLSAFLSWRLYSRARRMHARFEAAVSPRRIVTQAWDADRRGRR
jgi:hypothetical protein